MDLVDAVWCAKKCTIRLMFVPSRSDNYALGDTGVKIFSTSWQVGSPGSVSPDNRQLAASEDL
jgi:hypothetical protein